MQVQVFSRPGVGDVDDLGFYGYNGSFDACCADLRDATAETLEGFAKMMDAHQEVLFVVNHTTYTRYVVHHSRTWQ